MLTTDYIDYMTDLGNSNAKSVDQFLFQKWGFDYWKEDNYADIKSVLESTMVRVEVRHPAGYTYFEWQDR